MSPQAPEKTTVDLVDEAATLAFGAEIASILVGNPDKSGVIFLHGDLGAGKTTLVRGILRGLGFEGRVKSPTYTLVELYAISRLNLYHFDFYRLTDPDEWHEAGFRDLMNQGAVCLIEWPEKALGAGVPLPTADLEIYLSTTPDNRRRLTMNFNTTAGQVLAEALNGTFHPVR